MLDINSNNSSYESTIHNFIFKVAQNITITDVDKKRPAPSRDQPSQPSLCCEDCGNTINWVSDDVTGDTICGDCGVVVSEKKIASGKEWRSYNAEQENSLARVGPKQNIYMYDKGLSTLIDNSCRDSKGQILSPVSRLLQKRLKKTHTRFKSLGNNDRNFSDAMEHLHILSQTFHLTKTIKDEVVTSYRKIVNNQLLKGRTIKSILLALIYITLAENKMPVTVTDFCKKGGIEKNELTKYRRKVYKALKIRPKPIMPSYFLNSIHNVLQPDQGLILQFSNVLYSRIMGINPHLLQGKDPSGFASGIYYLASNILGYDCTQQQIRSVLNITDITIRQRYNEIVKTLFKDYKNLKILINNKDVDKSKIREHVLKLISENPPKRM